MIDYLIALKKEVAKITRGSGGKRTDEWPVRQTSLIHELIVRTDLEAMLEFMKPLPNVSEGSILQGQVNARIRTCIRRAIHLREIKDAQKLHEQPNFGRFS